MENKNRNLLENKVMGLDGKMHEQLPVEQLNFNSVEKPMEKNKNKVINTGTIMDGIENHLMNEENSVSIDELNKNIKLDEAAVKRLMAYQNRQPSIREYKKIGRNDLCPCGSGKKYKNCCLSSGKYEQLMKKK